MRTMIPLFAVAALAFTALPSVADETQAVAEIFACTYLDGKGWRSARCRPWILRIAGP